MPGASAFAQALVCPPVRVALQARFTVAVDTPQWSAVALMLESVFFRHVAMAASSCCLGAPSLRPSALALLMPAICRARMFSRSSSATPASRVSISFPVGLDKSKPSRIEMTVTPFAFSASTVSNTSMVFRPSRSMAETTTVSPFLA